MAGIVLGALGQGARAIVELKKLNDYKDTSSAIFDGVRLAISDQHEGLKAAIARVLGCPWQRCTVHFYRNVFTAVPQGKRKEVAAMLKAIHAQEDRQAAREKAQAVVAKLAREN